MRIVFGLVLIIGVALAGFAVYMTRGYLSDYQAELAHEKSLRAQIVQTEEIYVAAVSLNYGDEVRPDMVKKVKWPVEALPEGAFRTEEELFPEGLEVSRTALRAIEPMEALMSVKLTEPGKEAGLSARLSKGMRAFTIRVDMSTGVSGLLYPGDRVDVYWTGRQPGQDSESTKLIEASIRLIAVDQNSDENQRSSTVARTVTVEATPTQVAALATAQSTGRLSLALVGRDDDVAAGAVEVDQMTLLGIEQQAPAEPAPAERVCTVRTRKGGEIVTTQIPCPE